jgi:hypothetical protein
MLLKIFLVQTELTNFQLTSVLSIESFKLKTSKLIILQAPGSKRKRLDYGDTSIAHFI